MTGELRDWLLTCPQVKRVSALVVDAAAAGVFDLRRSIASGIPASIGKSAIIDPKRVSGRAFHGRIASHVATVRSRCTTRVDDDTVVISGSLDDGIGISEGRKVAALHINVQIPMTVVMALRGRRIDEVVDFDKLPIGGYDISAAELNDWGLTLWFNAPRVPLRTALDAAAAMEP